MKKTVNSDMSLIDLREVAKNRGVKKVFSMKKDDLLKAIENSPEPLIAQRKRSERVMSKVTDEGKQISKKVQAILDKTNITKTEKFIQLRKAGLKPIEISKTTDSNYSFVYGVLIRATKKDKDLVHA